jgi:hypothetical protein
VETTMTPQQLYETRVKDLTVVERLQLVKLVLDDLMRDPAKWVVDEKDTWSEEDYADLTRASLAYAATLEQEPPL